MSSKTKPNEQSQNPPVEESTQPPVNDQQAADTPAAPAKSKPTGPVYLKKDTDKKHPVKATDLDNVIVFQYRTRSIEGTEVKVPANHLNPIGIYTEDQYARHAEKGGLFDRLKVLHEVWHRPGQEGTIQE